MPGLGRNLFSVKQAARNGVVSIFDMTNPKLETHANTFPLQELGHDLYYLSLNLAGGGIGPELAMQAEANGNLWHRRLGHLNRKSLSLLENLERGEFRLACARLRCVRRGQESPAGSSQDRRSQG